jgi:hypothetical protein
MNYKKYSDKDLMESYSTALDYSGKANDDLVMEIERRGGIDQLKKNVNEQNAVPNEIKRINQLVFSLYEKQQDTHKIKLSITSEVLTPDQLSRTIDNAIVAADRYIKNHSINTKTIIGSLMGIVIGSLIGAALICYTVVHYGKLYNAVIIGNFVVSSILIWLVTKQNGNNVVVFIASFTAAFVSVPLGLWFCSLLAN